MKKILPIFLILSFMLSGCSVLHERIKEPVTFYYVRENFQKDMGQVIAAEEREASGHREDISYLLALYSMGPTKEGLISLLPKNTTILPTAVTDRTIELNLSSSALELTDAEYTLASACIALTCMELTGVEQVTVVCGERRIVIQEDNLLLDGLSIEKTQEELK